MTAILSGGIQNLVRGLLHGSAAIVAVAGLVALVVRSNVPSITAAVSIYGASLPESLCPKVRILEGAKDSCPHPPGFRQSL